MNDDSINSKAVPQNNEAAREAQDAENEMASDRVFDITPDLNIAPLKEEEEDRGNIEVISNQGHPKALEKSKEETINKINEPIKAAQPVAPKPITPPVPPPPTIKSMMGQEFVSPINTAKKAPASAPNLQSAVASAMEPKPKDAKGVSNSSPQPDHPLTVDPNIKPIRTYEGDFAEAMAKKHISTASIAIAEKKKKEQEALRQKEEEIRRKEEQNNQQKLDARKKEEEAKKRMEEAKRQEEARVNTNKIYDASFHGPVPLAPEKPEPMPQPEPPMPEPIPPPPPPPKPVPAPQPLPPPPAPVKPVSSPPPSIDTGYHVVFTPPISPQPTPPKPVPPVSAPMAAANLVRPRQPLQPAAEVPAAPSHSGRNFMMLLISILLIGGGIISGYYLYSISPIGILNNDNPLPAQNNLSTTAVGASVIAPDSQALLSTEFSNAASMTEKIRNEFDKPMAAKTIKEIVPVRTINGKTERVESTAMASALSLGLPDILHRSLAPGWMLGIYRSGDDKTSLFVVATNTFFQNAFAGMLQWEDEMADDLKKYMNFPQDGKITATSVEQGRFVDRIVRNRDVREYVTPDGQLVFLYSFVTNDKLVVATSEEALIEVISRLDKQTYVR